MREHGTRSKYAYGCRCTDCRAAKSAYDRARYVKRRDRASEVNWNITDPGKLPAEPLKRIASIRVKAGGAKSEAHVLGISGTRWLEWQRAGVPPLAADKVACRLGYHPAELWPGVWFEVAI